LRLDCLSYLQYQGTPVKASRLFAGNEHEEQTKKIADHFNRQVDYYKTVEFDPTIIRHLKENSASAAVASTEELINQSLFAKRDLSQFAVYEEAYHQLIQDIITQQQASTKLILQRTVVKQLFVDGGFSKKRHLYELTRVGFPAAQCFCGFGGSGHFYWHGIGNSPGMER
jgi:hypothetical protein